VTINCPSKQHATTSLQRCDVENTDGFVADYLSSMRREALHAISYCSRGGANKVNLTVFFFYLSCCYGYSTVH